MAATKPHECFGDISRSGDDTTPPADAPANETAEDLGFDSAPSMSTILVEGESAGGGVVGIGSLAAMTVAPPGDLASCSH